MGKRLISQKRGRGGIQYRAPQKGVIAPARFPSTPSSETMKFKVTDIVDSRGASAPLARLEISTGTFAHIPAANGLVVGSQIEVGPSSEIRAGNILPLENIPEGTVVSNIELRYGDGGKIVRAGGGSATLFSLTPSGAIIRLPSGKTSTVGVKCRAMIGRIAGWGRTEKPFMKAGTAWHNFKSRGKMYPRVRGIAMASVHHPFGGGRHQHPGKSTSVSRNAPPGRKVGSIASRKTGRKRVRRVR
ncbi:MAG: 50S ribosomal protein L2 [Nitrososphaerales archaeon]